MYNLIAKLIVKLKMTNDNNKTILYNVLGAFLLKGGAVIITLLTLPAYMKYFEDQQVLGVWFTILSVLSWILTFDLGIGNGLRNKLVSALVNNNIILAKKYISSAYIAMSVIAIIILAIVFEFFRFINWNQIFNISKQIITEENLYLSIIIVFSGIILQFVFRLITSILYAIQNSAWASFLSLLSSTIILIYISYAKPMDITSSLISISIIQVIAVNFPLLIATIIIFSIKLKDCKPDVRYFRVEQAKEVIILGGAFLWVQIMYMIITATNEFLISWLTVPDMVVEYQIYYKLFTIISTFYILALSPVWSMITKALMEKNYEWIKKIYIFLKKLTLLAIILEFSLIPFLQIVLNFWLKENAIQVNYIYAFIFAFSGSIFIWNGVLSSIANGFSELKVQGICFTIGAIIKVPIAWVLVVILDSWIGIILSNIIAMSFYSLIQPYWINRFLINDEFIKENENSKIDKKE